MEEGFQMQRIMFVDIDGPVINTPCYWVDGFASVQRTVLNTQSIGILNRLAALASARIVTNSTHNNYTVRETGRTLKDDLIKWGLKEEYIHENWCTTFPWPDLESDPLYPTHRRLRGIMEWEQENGEADWIAFDDEPFLQGDGRLMLINFDYGIDYNIYLQACNHWKLHPRGFVL
jgi:hypothetical protein